MSASRDLVLKEYHITRLNADGDNDDDDDGHKCEEGNDEK